MSSDLHSPAPEHSPRDIAGDTVQFRFPAPLPVSESGRRRGPLN